MILNDKVLEMITKLNKELSWQERVCSYCGGKLEQKTITENFGNKEVKSKRIVCLPCSRMEYGTSKRTFELASDLVRVKGYRYYGYDIIPDEEERIKADISYYTQVIDYVKRKIIDDLLTEVGEE